MDRTRLSNSVDLWKMDVHSVDSLMRSMRIQDGFKIEHLFLKTESSPSPSEDRFENVPCVLIQSLRASRRAAVLYIQGDGEVSLDDPLWVREVAGGGMAVSGLSLPIGESLARAVVKVVKGVSYLDLRRDLVDHGATVVWSRGESSIGGLIAAVLDDRVKGVVAEGLPPEVPLKSGESVATAAICGLLPPKRLLVLGNQGRGVSFEGVADAYRNVGRGENVRFEDALGQDGGAGLMNWVLGRPEG